MLLWEIKINHNFNNHKFINFPRTNLFNKLGRLFKQFKDPNLSKWVKMYKWDK